MGDSPFRSYSVSLLGKLTDRSISVWIRLYAKDMNPELLKFGRVMGHIQASGSIHLNLSCCTKPNVRIGSAIAQLF